MLLSSYYLSLNQILIIFFSFEGNVYNTKDVYNAVSKIKQNIADVGKLEEYLANIQLEGGRVNWSKNDAGEISVLWVQTQMMVSDMSRTKPWVWQTDATFSTNRLIQFNHIMSCEEDDNNYLLSDMMILFFLSFSIQHFNPNL